MSIIIEVLWKHGKMFTFKEQKRTIYWLMTNNDANIKIWLIIDDGWLTNCLRIYLKFAEFACESQRRPLFDLICPPKIASPGLTSPTKRTTNRKPYFSVGAITKKTIKLKIKRERRRAAMFSPDYEKRILKHCSPVARNLLNSFDAASSSSSLDRFIPCRYV